jgi:hypothetical protein
VPLDFEPDCAVEELLRPLEFERDDEELRRYLGYRGDALRRPLPGEIEAEVALAFELVEARGLYRVYPVEGRGPNRMLLGGITVSGKIAGFLAHAESVAVFLVTVGEHVTERSRARSQAGDPVAAWVCDAVGSYAAEAAAAALSKRLEQRVGQRHAVGPRYSPGYCGMDLGEQTSLFQLLEGARVGVALLPSMLMQPTKSVSGLLGIGAPGAGENATIPCSRCSSVNCSMRRT